MCQHWLLLVYASSFIFGLCTLTQCSFKRDALQVTWDVCFNSLLHILIFFFFCICVHERKHHTAVVRMKGVTAVHFFTRLLHTSHPFPCTECGEAFKRRKELDLHSLMHQGKSLTFIAHRCSSRRDDTHDAPTAVVRVLIYLQQKLNICLLLICGCLHLHYVCCWSDASRASELWGQIFDYYTKSAKMDGDDDDDDEKL